MAVVETKVENYVATVTINRPERRNALSAETYAGLSQAFTEIGTNDDVRAVVVTGAGDQAFSAGADLKDMSDPDRPNPSFLSGWSKLWNTDTEPLINRGLPFWKPVVAAVRGYCLGGGLTLLLATDVRVASTDAVFGVPEVLHGLIPANGGTQRLVRQIPYAVAMDMLLRGRRLSADEALHFGLITEAVEPEEVLKVAQQRAEELAAVPSEAVRVIKELAQTSAEVMVERGLRMERIMIQQLFDRKDAATPDRV